MKRPVLGRAFFLTGAVTAFRAVKNRGLSVAWLTLRRGTRGGGTRPSPRFRSPLDRRYFVFFFLRAFFMILFSFLRNFFWLLMYCGSLKAT